MEKAERGRIGYRLSRLVGGILVLFFSVPMPSHGYSVLTHEAVIDALWEPGIRPLLLARFPDSTPEELKEARAYAYGGCIIQDLGYYPFGSHLFTDLLHYVRSGDFIAALRNDAQDENEYAFALGAMAHYYSDTTGHPLGINPSVSLRYPKLRKKFGDKVIYAQAPKQHILVEFSFDVLQVAGGAYAPQAYHDFIGFEVATPLLERAFKETYGIEMKDVFFNEGLAIETYRRAVSKVIPDMTKVAWAQKHEDIEKLIPGVQRKSFLYRMSRRDYERDFGRDYERPGLGARFLSFILRFIPKVGPFRALSFEPPTSQMESLFQESFRVTRERYGESLDQLKTGAISFPNEDFDTGKPTDLGEYSLADQTYAELLDKLADRQFNNIPPILKANILRFYSSQNKNKVLSKKVQRRWEKTQEELGRLNGMATASANR